MNKHMIVALNHTPQGFTSIAYIHYNEDEDPAETLDKAHILNEYYSDVFLVKIDNENKPWMKAVLSEGHKIS